MKKKSRFLTGLLSAVMALSLFAMPAAAETAKSVINPNATGSITVHKYEYGEKSDKEGTGSANDDVPAGATPLNGAGFTVYKIWGKADLLKYYDGQSKVENLTQVLDWTNYASKAADGSYKLDLKNNCKATLVKEQQKTGENGADTGVTVFDDLEVGLYLVLETEVPDQVKEAAVPAIISLPMQKDSANTVSPAKDVTEWLYDIHIFPKNSTSYSGAKLVKKGFTGNNDDGTIGNVKFKLFKYNGTAENPEYTAGSAEWTELTKKTTAAGENQGDSLTLVTDANGEISVDGLAKGKYCFVEQGMIKDDGSDANTAYIISKEPVYFNVTAEGVVYKGEKTTTKDGKDAALVKNHKPDIEKKVGKVDGTFGEKADYSVGDLVPYEVTVTVPLNIANLKVFTVTDTPTNLDFEDKDEDHKLVVTSEDGKTPISSGYTLTKVGNGFNLAFAQGTLDDYAGQKIKIKYYDKLLEAAEGNTTAENTVALIYNNKLGTDGTPEGEDENGTTTEIHDDTVVYSFGIKVKKTDGNGKELDGVKFDLYKVDANGDKNLADFGWTGATEKLKLVKADLVTAGGGNINVTGLANGDYYLVEKETLPGYNMLSKAVKVELNITYTASWSDEKVYDNDGNLIHHTTTNLHETFEGGDKAGETFLTTNVINRKGLTLPTTGGFGTLLFSGIGALLVVGGVGVLMSTKKKKGNA